MFNTTVASLVIGAHIASHHHNDHAENFNPGVMVRVTDPRYSLLGGQPTAGLYLNSVPRNDPVSAGLQIPRGPRRVSVYGGLTWETQSKRFAATAALATGYDKRCKRETFPWYGGTAEETYCTGKGGALRVIGAVSVAWHEAQPYIGATPRLSWAPTKALHLSVEYAWH